MKIGELRRLLSAYDDEQLVLVEGEFRDYVEPWIYVTGLQREAARQLSPAISSASCPAVIIGTFRTFASNPL